VVQGESIPAPLYPAIRLLLRSIVLICWCEQIWEFFLAYSTIISRQGSATCYQITCVKNINSTHRIEGVQSQFGLKAALDASTHAGKNKFPVTR